jgi:hypothetical protein
MATPQGNTVQRKSSTLDAAFKTLIVADVELRLTANSTHKSK